MAGGRAALEVLDGDIADLGRRALPREAYFSELGARLRRVVPSDAMCWHTLDPDTLLLTSEAPDELIAAGVFTPQTAQEAGARIVACEYMADGVNTFAALARRRVPVGILGEAPRGRTRSARYEEVLAPAGIPFELRAAFVSRGPGLGRRPHGAPRGPPRLHARRRRGRGPRRRRDRGRHPHRAALRRGPPARRPVRAGHGRPRPGGRGAAGHGAGARAHGRPPGPALRDADERPPGALLAVAAHARQAAREGRAHPGAVAIPTGSGYVTVHAALPEGHAGGDVALVLERAPSPQATALRLEAHGVTEREREVAALLARGLTNVAIAERLVLSPYTVQDHIRSLFDKTGVGSRQELVARVFLDDYLPRVAEGAALGSNGSFA
jgi:DNA-binding CsgD family transcriptional regulator